MPDIRFYIVKNGTAELAACRIAEKAVGRGHQVHVRTTNEVEAEALDRQMWTFRSLSFLPHSLGEAPSPHVSVTIHHQWLPSQRDVLINLADRLPEDSDSFALIAEVVGPDEDAKAQGRERFRRYRSLGLEPESHEI